MNSDGNVLRIGLCGSTGRMGQKIIKLISNSQGKYCLHATHSSINDTDNLLHLCKADVIIDFSAPKILPLLLHYAQMTSTPLVIGTTGISRAHQRLIHDVSKLIPVFYAPNMSLLVNVLDFALAKIANFLDDSYDIEIIDIHHRNKVDAPSGTALMLGNTIADSKGWCFEKVSSCAASSNVSDNFKDIASNNVVNKSNIINSSLSGKKKIKFFAIRGGGVVGMHEVMFIGNNDILSIKHHALNRVIYAKGALAAAEWLLALNRVGLYSYLDLLNTQL